MVREMKSRNSIIKLYQVIIPWMIDFHAEGSENIILKEAALRKGITFRSPPFPFQLLENQ